MKFLLKIVQGPNAGAEIALVEGVRVTLGSADSCDIVLADPTLPAEACAIEASADAVVLTPSGAEPETLEPLRVRSFGSTALAVGPADSPWGPLSWEAPSRGEAAEGASEEAQPESAPPKEEDSAAPDSAKSAETEEAGDGASEPAASARKRGRFLGCLIALVALLLLLAAAAWLLFPRASPADTPPDEPGSVPEDPSSGLADLAARYGLDLVETNGTTLARGDFATRAERVKATAELYEAQPDIALDLADIETLRNSTADLLAAATDGAIKVADVTNRVAVLAGRALDPAFLAATIEALRADVPRLAGVDTAAVSLDSLLSAPARPAAAGGDARPARAQRPRLPLRSILLQPYPCIVLQDGQRLLEGAEVGGYKISRITFDRIVFRNEAGEELEWTP